MKNTNPDYKPSVPGTNANTVPSGGRVNPSAPTSGTETYGSTSDERRNVNTSGPSASDPANQGAGDVRRASHPRNEAADNPATDIGEARSRSEQRTENRNAVEHTVFSCADFGMDCQWSLGGNSIDGIMPYIERHGRDAHGIKSFHEIARQRIRDIARERHAA